MTAETTGRTSVDGTPPWGAEIREDGVVLRLWAPQEKRLRVELAGRVHEMRAVDGGWFEFVADRDAIGAQYRFVLADGLAVPDPASRRQAGTVDGPSRIVAVPASSAPAWGGRPWEEAVLYEMHIGTFTPQGTFRAAIDRLDHLADLGITFLEIMPVAHFHGRRGWGYDGVLHYAPHSAYGSPDDMRAFVDAAHARSLGVILDVVYNHFGPEGNYIGRYAPGFFRDDRQTPWGAAIDFSSRPVRRYFIDNALYWIRDFGLDGLRFDAVEQIYDSSPRHILDEIAERVHATVRDRPVHLIVEDQRNDVGLLLRNEQGRPKTFTAEWNDDFHHVAHVIATGESGGHYTDFSTRLEEKLALSLARGFVFPNRGSAKVAPMTGADADTPLAPTCFIDFLQNHDQIGNRAFGDRLLDSAGEPMVKVLTAILLLSPPIPFLFMGQDYAEKRPFQFFCDYEGDLAEIIRRGRLDEARGFGGLAAGRREDELPDPNAESTFEACKLDWTALGRQPGRGWHAFTRQLLDLRRTHIVPLLQAGAVPSVQVEKAGDGVVALTWRFGARKLCLRANLSQTPRAAPSCDGEVIFALPPGSDCGGTAGLAGRSVVFSLTPPAAGAR